MNNDEGNYFDRRIHDDINEIIKHIREMHKGRSKSTTDDPQSAPLRLMESVFNDLAAFKGSPTEKSCHDYLQAKSNHLFQTDR